MKRNKIRPVVIALDATIALGTGTASAVDLESMTNKAMDKAKDTAKSVITGEARDMQGNELVIDPETGFSYGGDGMGIYAGGKVGTGSNGMRHL